LEWNDGLMRQATPAERLAFGRAARANVPRSSHGDWEPPSNRADPLEIHQQKRS
jgi:hypothetical protein